MLVGYDDSIGQSILSILIPSGGVYINRNVIRNLSSTIGYITEEMDKAIAAQQKSLPSPAWVALDNYVALDYLLDK